MKHKLCDIDRAAREKLPRFTDDKSGIGVHYVDALPQADECQAPKMERP